MLACWQPEPGPVIIQSVIARGLPFIKIFPVTLNAVFPMSLINRQYQVMIDTTGANATFYVSLCKKLKIIS